MGQMRNSQQTLAALQADLKGFQPLSDLLRTVAGIHLAPTDKNRSLMATRLLSILRDGKFKNYREYYNFLMNAEAKHQKEFVIALTTNTTQFFREPAHFDFLKKALPELLERKRRAGSSELRVWCAAASTGQEPYTIAMVVREQVPEGSPFQIRFLATDIDTDVLKKAANGVYSEAEARGVPPTYLQKYFTKKKGAETTFTAKDELRNLIRFAPLNLVEEPYPFQHGFDIIFCRNVLIYFDTETTALVTKNLMKSLAPGGLLLLGHSESGAMRGKEAENLAAAVYRKSMRKGA